MNHNLINNLTYKNKIDNNKLYENDYNQIRESLFNIEKKKKMLKLNLLITNIKKFPLLLKIKRKKI